MDALISGPRPRRRPSTGGSGLPRGPELSVLRSSRQPRPILPRWPAIPGYNFPGGHVTLLPTVEAPPHWWNCYPPRPSLPRTGSRQSPLRTEDPCSPLREAPIDEVYSVLSYKGAPGGRRRGWPKARPTSVSSPPWWLAAGASTLRDRPHTVELPWLRLPAAYGEIWCIGAEHGCTPRGDERSPRTTSTPRRHGPGSRHTRIADRMQVAPQPGRSRLRVLVGRRFFRPGDGYSGRRHEVLVAMGSRPPRESSSPSRWASWPARIEWRVAHCTATPTATSIKM